MNEEWRRLVGHLIEIDWWDIEEHDECTCRTEDMKLCECASFGRFLVMDEYKIVLETERRGDETTRQVFPIGCIFDIFELKVE